MKTEDIIKLQRRTRIHAANATPDGWVSSTSKWTADIWRLDSSTARMRDSDCTIVWDTDLPATLTESLKTLAWSMLVSRPREKPMALSNVSRLGQRLRYLGRWMAWRRHADFGSITPTAVKVYRKDLVEYLSKDENGKPSEIDVETNSVSGYLLLLQYAYDQGPQLKARSIRPIVTAPFEGSSAWEVAARRVRWASRLPASRCPRRPAGGFTSVRSVTSSIPSTSHWKRWR